MHALVRNWWVPLVRGIVAVVFGVIVAARPAAGLLGIVLAFGAYAIVFGAFAIGAAVMYSPERRGELWIEGAIAIIAGVATFVRPGITALALYSLIAIFSLITGVMQIVGAVRLRRDVNRWGWLVASGVISVLFGILMVALPAAGALALAWLIAVYGIAIGITLIALSLELRRVAHRRAPPTTPPLVTPQPA
jgi:uncharacterized membrane protein HdeD (DUF308 family)